MTVAELIEHLKKHRQDLPVVVHGYEGGLWELTEERIERITMARDENSPGIFGPHERVYFDDIFDKTEQALLLARGYGE